MRFDIECEAGDLAANPERALSALCDLARADGADPHEWLEKALKSAGVTQLAVQVSQDPPHQVVLDATLEVIELYDRVMVQMREALVARIGRAVRDADISRYVEMAQER